MSNSGADVLQGTLDLLILKTLSLGPMHGWGVSQRIQQISREALHVGQGSLYPALYRLERQGLIDRQDRMEAEIDTLVGRILATFPARPDGPK